MRYVVVCCTALLAMALPPTVAVASALPAELQNEISTAGPFTTEGAKVFEVVVSAGPGGGPVTAPVTTTVVAAEEGTTTVEWISSAGGDGWRCAMPEDTAKHATCTRSDPLPPGRSYPPIRFGVEVNEWAPQLAYFDARTDSAAARDPRCADASIMIDFNAGPASGRVERHTAHHGPADPALSTSLAYAAEGAVDVTIASRRGTAATRGQVSVFIAFEPGYPSAAEFQSVSGAGWRCSQGYGQVTCTRSDVLWPGQSYPPIRVSAYAYVDLGLYAKTTTAGTCEEQCSSGDLKFIAT